MHPSRALSDEKKPPISFVTSWVAIGIAHALHPFDIEHADRAQPHIFCAACRISSALTSRMCVATDQ